MKKLLLSSLCAAAILSACGVEDDELTGPGKGPRDGRITREVTINASLEDRDGATRTELGESNKVNWLPGDRLMVYSAGESSVFTSQNEEPARSAKFKGAISMLTGAADEGAEPDYVWAIYPYRDDLEYQEPEGKSATALITTTLPAVQQGKANSFANNLAISLGRSSSLDISLKNAYSGIHVNFQDDDIVSVTLAAIDGENIAIAGKVRLGLDSKSAPFVESAIEPSNSITLVAPDGGAFKAGEKYYILTLPATMAKGYSFTVRKADGREGTFYRKASTTFTQNSFRHIDEPLDYRIGLQKNIDAGTSTGWTQSATQGLNEIWYTSTDGAIVEYAVDGATGNEVVSNTYADGKGVIRFSGILTEVDEDAFFLDTYNSTLETVSLPDKVETIKDGAFNSCLSLKEVKLPAALKSIGAAAFEQCPLTEIVFPEGLEEIGYYAFANCPNLKSVTLPESVKSLGTYSSGANIASCFLGCGGLEAFHGKFASEDHRCLIAVMGSEKILNSFAPAGMEGQVYAIPQGVTRISPRAFQDAPIAGVVFPSSLTKIMDMAFFRCESLKTLTIPATVTHLGPEAFMACYSMEWIRIEGSQRLINLSLRNFNFPLDRLFDETNDCPIYVPEELLEWYKKAENWNKYAARYESIISNNEIRYTASAKLRYRTGANAPDGFTHSWDEDTKTGVFTSANAITEVPTDLLTNANKSVLETVTLPNSVETIAGETFSGCRNLTSVNFGTGLKTIGTKAFYNCYNLESVTLPDGLKTIRDFAFAVGTEHLDAETGYSKLSSVYIPESVKEIYGDAFGWNVNLKTINVPAGATVYANPVTGCRSLESFTGSSNLIADGGRILIDSEGKFLALAPGGLTPSGGYTSYSVPEGVKTVWQYAMAYLDNLEEVTLPKTLETLQSSAFNGSGIDRIILKGTQTSLTDNIPDHALSSGYNIWIPGAGVSYYTNSSTPYWPDMERFVVYQADDEIWYHIQGDEISEYGTYINASQHIAFHIGKDMIIQPAIAAPEGATAFNVVRMSEDVTTTADNMYADPSVPIDWCSLPNTVTTIGKGAFKNCSLITRFPAYRFSNLTTIGDDSFSGCVNLKYGYDSSDLELIGPSHLTTIGERAFENCTSIKKIWLYGNLNVGESAFKNCSDMTEVRVYGSLPVIKTNTFLNCYSLTDLLLLEPESTVTIEGIAFMGDENLIRIGHSYDDGINLPSLTSLGINAFYGCTSITKAIIGPVATIPDRAFMSCLYLEKVTLTNPEKLNWIGSGAFGDCLSLKTIGGASTPEGSAIFPAVSTIRFNGVFDGTQIENLEIPKAQNLTQGALQNMTKLTTLDASGLKVLQRAALSGCANLKTLNLPSIQQLGMNALEGSSVQDLTLGEGLVYIGKLAFANSTGTMNNLYFLGATPPDASVYVDAVDPTAFKKTEGGENLEIKKIHVPSGKTAVYLDAFVNASSDYQAYSAVIVED